MTKATHESVRDVLATCGPLTTRELMEFFRGSDQRTVAAIVSTQRNAAVKRIYVHSWQRHNGVGKPYLTAVYAVGNKPDAKKPGVMSHSERCRRWREKQQLGRTAPNSVWQLGQMA